MSYPVAKHRATGGSKKGYVKDTPIYRASIDLLNFALNTTKDFSRQMRPTLGKILIESTVDLVGKVCKANAARQRVVREALRLGYTVDPRGTKVFDYGQR